MHTAFNLFATSNILAAVTAAGAAGLFLCASGKAQTVPAASASLAGSGRSPVRGSAPDEIRPFHINANEKALTDLRRRLGAVRWPDRETVTDRSQGVQLATMKQLVRYWQTDYNWRK